MEDNPVVLLYPFAEVLFERQAKVAAAIVVAQVRKRKNASRLLPGGGQH